MIFPRPLRGEYIGGGTRWRLTDLFVYNNPPVMIIVSIGYITDGASIPRFAWNLIGSPWSGKYAKSAVIHDYLYHTQTTTRLEADKIFLEGMKVLGVSWWRRGTMYNAVRLASWIPWNRRRKELCGS